MRPPQPLVLRWRSPQAQADETRVGVGVGPVGAGPRVGESHERDRTTVIGREDEPRERTHHQETARRAGPQGHHQGTRPRLTAGREHDPERSCSNNRPPTKSPAKPRGFLCRVGSSAQPPGEAAKEGINLFRAAPSAGRECSAPATLHLNLFSALMLA
jgi:hypothetical protein